ncbi:hypothetical protein JNW88_06435 [Micromonospora sp. ATA32]|nr:hypothetical protein [Micromonospora sp. ATA32]
MTGAGRFTQEVMAAAMHQVAAHLGVRADNAQLLRFTNNAVFALPSAGIVIRLASGRDTTRPAEAARTRTNASP